MRTDTIAAIASGGGGAGIGIVRISGEDAVAIAERIFRPGKRGNAADADGCRSLARGAAAEDGDNTHGAAAAANGDDTRVGTRLSEKPSHTIHYGYIVDGDEIIDEVLLLLLKAPRTYTREDTVEIDCHGGRLVMRRILETVLKNGARLAEPGEYTKRAFLNGRIDLSQAESVADIIQAENELALKNSLSQLEGRVRDKIRDIRGIILEETARIEAALDDPEHLSLEDGREILLERMEEVRSRIDRLLDSAKRGNWIKKGITTVLIGKPNAGKSSWLNLLAGKERAIVTDIAGTTRDRIEEQIEIGGVGLRIIDTAGIRQTEELAEKIGVRMAKESMERADLILYVADSSTLLDENDEEILAGIRERRAIVLLNKSDLAQRTSKEDIRRRTEHPLIEVSAKCEEGIRELEDVIKKMFFEGEISFDETAYISNERQRQCLFRARESVERVFESMRGGLPEDFYTIDMTDAYACLGEVIGEAVRDDLADEIFGRFCMGK